jgi:hypothetical protein
MKLRIRVRTMKTKGGGGTKLIVVTVRYPRSIAIEA